MDSATQVQILDEAFSILHNVNILTKEWISLQLRVTSSADGAL